MPTSFKRRLWLPTVAGLLVFAAACGGGKGGSAAPTETPSPERTPTGVAAQPAVQATTLPVISATTTSSNLSPERIQLAVSTATRYYTVTGRTTAEIFDSIDRNGPRDDKGVKGSGLTAASWGYRWQPQNSPDGCVIASMTISLDIVVTLPRHDQAGGLPFAIQANWQKFADSVAKHEQTHVDIDKAGASTIREKMLALRPAANCDALSRQVEALWNAEQRAIENAQAKFHADEDARIAALRAPLQSQIDTNRARISTLASQIQSLDAQLAAMNSELTNVNNQLDALKTRIDRILADYPSGNLPPDVYAEYEDLRRLYNALAPNFNAVVAQYNSSIAQRNQIADEHDRLVDATNLLVDQFNWTR